MLGNHLPWIPCTFVFLSHTVQELCASDRLSLAPLAVRQPSRLSFFPTCLYMVYGETCCLGSKVWEAKQKSRGQEGLTGEILSSPLQCQVWGQIHPTNTPRSTFNAAHLCSSCWPCCELGEGGSSQLQGPHSVLNFCQIMGWKSLKNQQLNVPVSTNLSFLFWCSTCEHGCPDLSWTAKFLLQWLGFDKAVAFQ